MEPKPVPPEEDARTLAVSFDHAGVREGHFAELVKQLREEDYDDWRIAGPRTALWLCQQLVSSGMTP
eukprot:7467137-Lingulodinium_polyedra.AAC.1